MLRKIIVILLLIASEGVFASQNYLIAFVNDNPTDTLSIENAGGNKSTCMHAWDVPESAEFIGPGMVAGPYYIQDADATTCANEPKTDTFTVKKISKETENSTDIEFFHINPFAGKTRTTINQVSNMVGAVNVTSARCNIDNDCLNSIMAIDIPDYAFIVVHLR